MWTRTRFANIMTMRNLFWIVFTRCINLCWIGFRLIWLRIVLFFGLCHLVVSRFQYFQFLDEYPKNIAHNGYNCVQWILYEVQHRNARHCIKNINVAIVFVNMTTVWKIMNLHLISTIAQYTCMQIADIVHSQTHAYGHAHLFCQ